MGIERRAGLRQEVGDGGDPREERRGGGGGSAGGVYLLLCSPKMKVVYRFYRAGSIKGPDD